MKESINKLSIKKIHREDLLDQIVNENEKRRHYWESKYPNHIEWIKKVIANHKKNTYERVILGGFANINNEEVFCCSVILKKNPFTTFLEIKNLILFESLLKECAETQEKLNKLLLKHISLFAEERGYTKLIIELTNTNLADNKLIKLFLEEDFVIAGSQTSLYADNNDVVYLVKELSSLYSLDSFDYDKIAFWIMDKYIGGGKLNYNILSYVKVSTIDRHGKSCDYEGAVHTYKISRNESDSMLSNLFSLVIQVLVINESTMNSRITKEITNIERTTCNNSSFFVFNFTEIKIKEQENIKLINKSEIDNLINLEKMPLIHTRLSYREIGGLLLMSDPKIFPFEKLKDNIRDNIVSVYIKLGALGQFIDNRMPIFLAYFNSKNRLSIWGILHQDSRFPESKNIYELEGENSKDKYENFYQVLIRDGTSPLWNLDEFKRHSSYNSSGNFICYFIKNFDEYRDEDADNIIIDNSIIEGFEEKYQDQAFDFYVSKKEVNNILKKKQVIDNRRNEINMDKRKNIIEGKICKEKYDNENKERLGKILYNKNVVPSLTATSKKELRKIIDNSYNRSQETINSIIQKLKSVLPEFLHNKEYSNISIGLFGSVGRLEMHSRSDVEFVIVYESNESDVNKEHSLLTWNIVRNAIEEIGFEWEGKQMFEVDSDYELTTEIYDSYVVENDFPNKYLPIIDIRTLLSKNMHMDARLKSRYYQLLTELTPIYNPELLDKLKMQMINDNIPGEKSWGSIYHSSFFNEIMGDYYNNTRPEKFLSIEDVKKFCYRVLNVLMFKISTLKSLIKFDALHDEADISLLLKQFNQSPFTRLISLIFERIDCTSKEIDYLFNGYIEMFHYFSHYKTTNGDLEISEAARIMIKNIIETIEEIFKIIKRRYPQIFDKSPWLFGENELSELARALVSVH